MVTRRDGKLASAIVDAPTATPSGARGNGWTVRLNDGWGLAPGAAGEMTVSRRAR